MLILAVDTATDYATFAIGDSDGVLIAGEVFPHNRSLSQQFYAAMQRALVEANFVFSAIDVLAVGVGPGSFTGVRVGVATMRTLAQASQKRLVGIGTLQIFAHEASQTHSGRLLAILPSRKGEVYFQEYNGASPISLPSVAPYDALEHLLVQSGASICGQTAALPVRFERFVAYDQAFPRPSSLITLAAARAQCEQFDDPLSLAPVYAALPAISQHKSR
jgi:tRNA threonylcarbamoyladenosine biosynthesis protein TsaB